MSEYRSSPPFLISIVVQFYIRLREGGGLRGNCIYLSAVVNAAWSGALLHVVRVPCILIVSLNCGSRFGGSLRAKAGRVAERLMATGCKPVAPCELRRFESSPVHQN